MIVTISTDASFDRRLKRGAYAYWISTDKGKLRGSGILKQEIERPEEAELMAMTNALHYLSLRTELEPTVIVMNTDCMNAIHFMTSNTQAIRLFRLDFLKPVKTIFKTVWARPSLINAKIIYRHIVGHGDIVNKREFVNAWCDRTAKKELSKFRKYLKTIQNAN